MTADRSSSTGDARAPSCWYCDRPLGLDYLLRDAILRPRSERDGGPYHLYFCTCCNRQNHCEKSKKKRWFSSPDTRPGRVDYLLGRFVGQPQDFLKTMSWYEANEERRRYFFEHDGDYRYSGGWLKRLLRGSLFPSKTGMPEAGGGEPRAKRKEEDTWERDAGGKKEKVGQAPPRTAPRLVTPWQILGVKANASPEEIRVAFHKLAVQYHPDKVHHMGEDFQKVAHEKFLELQKAYKRLSSRSP